MATGFHYVQAIEMILDTELRTQQGVRDNEVAERVKFLVEPFDIDPRSRRLAGAVKAIKTKSGADGGEEQRKVFRDRFPQLEKVRDEDLNSLIAALTQAIWDIDQGLYKSRTSLSTVSTVLRPLSTKWLERWKLIRTDNFDYDRTMQKVQGLWDREIFDIESLRIWMEDVYDLFVEVVVFHRQPGAPVQTGAPMGMVGSGNERMYRRNWTSFRADFETQLMEVAGKVSKGDLRSALGTPLGMSYVSTYISQRNDLTNRLEMEDYAETGQVPVPAPVPVPAQDAPDRKYEVKFESAQLGEGEATKPWSSKESLRDEIVRFMTLIAGTWDKAGELINVTFTFPSNGLETTVRVANKSPQDAAEAVIRLLDLAD